MKDVHLSPAEYVIRQFKGVRATARAIGRSPSSVSKWRCPKGEKRGCDGQVPGTVQRVILEKARELGLDITPSDLINGRVIASA